jgi:tetratricopeptide (TPR) repeat protein
MRSRRCAKITPFLLATALFVLSQNLLYGVDAKGQEMPSITPAMMPLTMTPEQRGDLLMVHHQYLDAIDAYRHAPRDSAVVWNKLGIAYHHVYALDQAKMDYQQALLLKPRYPEAMNNLGAIYYAERDYKRAEKYYQRALKLVPKSAKIYNNLGTAYFAEGKFNKGTEAYRTAFALDSQVFEENPLETISESSTSVDRARLDFCLAELYAEAGMKDQAIEFLRKAIDAGFNDNKRMMQDPKLANIRNTAEFAQVIALAKQP